MKRFEVAFNDFRGWFVHDVFLVKIVFSGSESDCNDYAEKHNNDFHSTHKLVSKRGRLEIKRL